MKINHFFLAITIALAAGACSDNTFIPAEDEETVSMSNAQSIQRSEDEAMAYAAQFLNIFPHNNWGWGGYGNGYFNPEVFNPEDAESYDFMSSGMNKDYKYNLKYIAFYQEQMSIL